MSSNTFDSVLYPDMKAIFNSPERYKPYFLYSTILHTKDKDLGMSEGVFISGKRLFRDYLKGYSDLNYITLFVRPDTWFYDLYPYLDDLELTLSTFKQLRVNGQTVLEEETFKAVYVLEENTKLPTSTQAKRNDLTMLPSFQVTLQLVDKHYMALRTSTIQGVFDEIVDEENKDMSSDKVIKSLISSETNDILVEGEPVIERISIERAKNKEPLKKLVIPTGTELFDLPRFIHEERGGVYTAGINTYLQGYAQDPKEKTTKTLFTYSLYDGNKFELSQSPIIIIVPPNGDLGSVDKTYSYKGNNLRIISNPIDNLDSTKGAILRAEGDGFKTASADAMSVNPVEITPEGPMYKKTGMMTEVINKEQPDGLNYAPHEGISGNHFVETSRVLARSGEYLKISINNLDKDFYYPGAPVKIMYEPMHGVLQELQGVLHRAMSFDNYNNIDFNEESHREKHGLNSVTIFDVFITEAPDNDLSNLVKSFL